MTEQEKKVLEKLQLQCARREYCENDVFMKAFGALDGDRDAARRVVDALVSEKYVDNLRYASAFAREKASLTGWGAVKISYMLASKGIDRQVIALALEEIDDSSADRKMETVIRTKYRMLKDDPQVRLKLLKFALGRGYSYDDVRALVDKIISEADE